MLAKLLLAAFASVALAAPAALTERDACVARCSTKCYWQSDIDDAVNAGYGHLQDGSLAGNYPHQYNDFEGFSFPTSGPYYEFPILSTFKVYTGGAPGADRVIFDADGNFDSVITHTGASGNNFVACSL
ncbi:Guanyl-specific ribonuclease N1 [Vanrija pseudolonga]|uniref:Guanyl-specific ribonuclease N1 n=1 Tax=Vanrija pseudolonga TaxID=143232 RepID=A0AAF0YI97_9TREE|nr:Guanyl-specific ribonuclease N1 [Vanrija pseudolonga]